MITSTKRLLLTYTILGLLATNVLTLTGSAFNTALSSLMSTAMLTVCEPELPDAGDVWDGVVDKSGEWLHQAREAM